jgi:hypothetical protein
MKVGPASKRPAISTNEGPPTKRVTISVHSVRQPDSTYPVVFKPYRVYVSRAGEVEVDEAKFTVTNVSDEDLELKIVSEPFGYLEIDLPDEVKAGESAECKIKVKEDHLNQSFEKSITLELNDPTKTRFSVPIIRRLIGAKKTQASKAGSH